jgi:hypothetical protein
VVSKDSLPSSKPLTIINKCLKMHACEIDKLQVLVLVNMGRLKDGMCVCVCVGGGGLGRIT